MATSSAFCLAVSMAYACGPANEPLCSCSLNLDGTTSNLRPWNRIEEGFGQGEPQDADSGQELKVPAQPPSLTMDTDQGPTPSCCASVTSVCVEWGRAAARGPWWEDLCARRGQQGTIDWGAAPRGQRAPGESQRPAFRPYSDQTTETAARAGKATNTAAACVWEQLGCSDLVSDTGDQAVPAEGGSRTPDTAASRVGTGGLDHTGSNSPSRTPTWGPL